MWYSFSASTEASAPVVLSLLLEFWHKNCCTYKHTHSGVSKRLDTATSLLAKQGHGGEKVNTFKFNTSTVTLYSMSQPLHYSMLLWDAGLVIFTRYFYAA